MRNIPFVVLMSCILLFCSPRKKGESMLLNSEFVDLKGRTTFTIVVNSTNDTLKMEAAIYGMIPIAEETSQLTIAPGQSDTITFSQSYPDFIHFDGDKVDLKVFNAPGRILVCDIKNISPNESEIAFTGDLSQINDYYLAHQNHFGAKYEHNRPYYLAGDTVKSFDRYPAIVDSITEMSRRFLKQYTAPLPNWFVAHENARLNFKSGFIKHNCPATKEFYEARTIPKSPSYFDFDKSLSFSDGNIVLCLDYLNYALHRIPHIAKTTKAPDKLRPEYRVIDSLYGESDIGDVLRISHLSWSALGSLSNFREQLALINFGDSTYRILIDSLVKERLGVPAVDKVSPDASLIDVDGSRVRLSSFKGNVLLFNFWATWCGPCIKEFPAENKVHLRYADKGFLIVNICVESKVEKWRALTAGHGLRMINLFCPPGEYASLKKAFDLSSFPRSVLVGKDFKVNESYADRASQLDNGDILKWIRE